jgi:hypothetical protein
MRQYYCACRYALGDLLEMAGYGRVDRAASNVRVSGMHTDAQKVTSGKSAACL